MIYWVSTFAQYPSQFIGTCTWTLADDTATGVNHRTLHAATLREGLASINVSLGWGGRGGGRGGGWDRGFPSLSCTSLNITIYLTLHTNEHLRTANKGDVFCRSWTSEHNIDSLIIRTVIIYLMDMSRQYTPWNQYGRTLHCSSLETVYNRLPVTDLLLLRNLLTFVVQLIGDLLNKTARPRDFEKRCN